MSPSVTIFYMIGFAVGYVTMASVFASWRKCVQPVPDQRSYFSVERISTRRRHAAAWLRQPRRSTTCKTQVITSHDTRYDMTSLRRHLPEFYEPFDALRDRNSLNVLLSFRHVAMLHRHFRKHLQNERSYTYM